MAADISRARAAQSGRLSALRGLRTSGGGGAPGGGGRAAAAPLGGGGPAPIACVLPLSSSEQAVQRLVASPSGRSAAVIFEDSTAQVHPLPGCAALARATSLMMPSSVPCFVLRASLPRACFRSGSAIPDAATVSPLALGAVTDACCLSLAAPSGDLVVTTGVATSLLTRLRVWSVALRRALPLEVQMPDGITDGGGAPQTHVRDELLLPAPAFGVKLAAYGDCSQAGDAMVAVRSAVHGRAWVWRLELELESGGGGGEMAAVAVAHLKLIHELGGTAKEHSAAALLLGGRGTPRLVLGGAAGVRWWAQQAPGASSSAADDDAAAEFAGSRGCFAEVREQERHQADEPAEVKADGKGGGDEGGEDFYDDDDDDEVRAPV
jgi:hypothetical protein